MAMAGLSMLATLLAGTASAQATSDNDTVVNQAGIDNNARVEQAGSFNRAGSADRPLFQDGIYNDIDIFQRGNQNIVGLSAPGVQQTGRQNTQTVFNRIFIRQTSDDNTVGSITQTSEGSVALGANTLRITQSGRGNNAVETVRQTQADGQVSQFATVEQSGESNRIALIDQFANSNLENLSNEITVVITGFSNGITGLSDYAAQVNVTDSGIVQEGGNGDLRSNGNLVDLMITGDQNRFGIRQGGSRNDVGALTLNGNDNQIGLRQDGSDNDITIAPIDGDSNIIGVDQLGTNITEITLGISSSRDTSERSDNNRILVLQSGTNRFVLDLEGDSNVFSSTQGYDHSDGGDNVAVVRIIGNGNIGHLSQSGNNVFELTLTGDDNNAMVFDRDFDSVGQTAGALNQTGDRNRAAFTVDGSSNRFGFTQTGTMNAAIATISGSGNQMALAQLGSDNIAHLFQIGQNNRAIVHQE